MTALLGKCDSWKLKTAREGGKLAWSISSCVLNDMMSGVYDELSRMLSGQQNVFDGDLRF